MAQSSAETKYVAAASAANQAIWLRKILQDLMFSCELQTTFWIDSKSAISMAKNPVDHGRTKHIRIKFHAIREAVKNGEVAVEYCPTKEQLVDIFTKGLSTDQFKFLRDKLGVCSSGIKEVC